MLVFLLAIGAYRFYIVHDGLQGTSLIRCNTVFYFGRLFEQFFEKKSFFFKIQGGSGGPFNPPSLGLTKIHLFLLFGF